METNKKTQKWEEKASTKQKKKNKTLKEDGKWNITKEIKKSSKRKPKTDIEQLRAQIPNKPGVYKIINKVNGKFYIGSSVSLYKRLFYEHLNKLKSNLHDNTHLQKAWNLYGEENFIFEILELVEPLENEFRENFKNRLVQESEQYYLDTLLFAKEYINGENIKFKELGYNNFPLAHTVVRTNEFKEKLRLTNNGKTASNETKEKIRNSKLGESNNWSGKPALNRCVVIQYDLNNNFIKEWDSITEAHEALGINRSKIGSVCRGIRKHTGGFIWKYKHEKDKEEKLTRKIVQKDLFGNFVKIWNSLSQIENELKMGRQNISSVCKGKKYSSHGFKWEYFNY